MRKFIGIVAILVLFAGLLTPAMASSQTAQQTPLQQELKPQTLVIGVRDTSIYYNGQLVGKTLPSNIAGILLMVSSNDTKSFTDKVQSFINDYKSTHQNAVVIEYYFKYTGKNKENQTVTVQPHVYNNVDYILIAPLNEKELSTYLNEFSGRKLLVAVDYMPYYANVTTNTTNSTNVTQNISFKPIIPVDKLINLYKEGKIYGVVMPFYEVEKTANRVLFEQMRSDANTFRIAGVPVIGVVQPFINTMTGSTDTAYTEMMIALSQKTFGSSIYLSWGNAPITLLHDIDPSIPRCSSGFGSKFHFSLTGWTGIALIWVPSAIIIILIIYGSIKSKHKEIKEKKRKNGKKDDKNNTGKKDKKKE